MAGVGEWTLVDAGDEVRCPSTVTLRGSDRRGRTRQGDRAGPTPDRRAAPRPLIGRPCGKFLLQAGPDTVYWVRVVLPWQEAGDARRLTGHRICEGCRMRVEFIAQSLEELARIAS